MIKNEQQFRITNAKLADMTARLDRLRAKYPKQAHFRFYSETTRNRVEQMQRELGWYAVRKPAIMTKPERGRPSPSSAIRFIILRSSQPRDSSIANKNSIGASNGIAPQDFFPDSYARRVR